MDQRHTRGDPEIPDRHRLAATGPLEEMVVGGSVNRGYVFRFEAEGYKPFITRAYQADEGEVRLDAELEPAQEILAMVFRPDGTPASKAQVALIAPGSEVRLRSGGFAGDLGHALAWLRQADGDGWFVVPDDHAVEHVIVASPEGYAQTSAEELAKARAVRLAPWSRIEGVIKSAGHPIPEAEVRLLWQSPASGLRFDVPSIRSDGQGRFSFQQVPPGTFQVEVGGRLVEDQIAVLPGETVTVDLGDDTVQ
jgi:hypothetical protein